MGRFTNRFKISKEKRENLKRTLKNMPRKLWAKIRGKPFHKTMKYKEEKKRLEEDTLGQKKQRNKKRMEELAKLCRNAKETNEELYRFLQCKSYENKELTQENINSIREVDINAINLPVGDTNVSSVNNLPLVPLPEPPQPMVNFSQGIAYTAEDELENIRNAIRSKKYVRNENLKKLGNTGDWDNLKLLMRYAAHLQKMKNRGSRVKKMSQGGTRKRKNV